MIKLTQREKIIIAILFVALIFAMGGKYYINQAYRPIFENADNEVPDKLQIAELEDPTEMEKKEIDIPKEILVDICGEVKIPGVVRLIEGARVVDAVELAGGLLETADRNQVNMARPIHDGEQIYIPKKGETNNSIHASNTTSPVYTGTVTQKAGKINLNQASQSDLESLNGIGKVLAGKIIQYRDENGSFQRIEDIMKVNGIGEKRYEGIKDSIYVE